MNNLPLGDSPFYLAKPAQRSTQSGAALATTLIVLSLLSAISMTVLAVVTHESRIAGSDLQRTQTFYAAAAGIEKMSSDFSDLFTRTSRPTTAQLNTIAASYPTELTSEGFSFNQSLNVDATETSGLVTIPSGPFSGLIASVTPYLLNSTATQTATGTQVSLQRKINNYLIPIFQFGMFSNKDIELHPGPPFSFNGRVHANGNIYVNGDVTFLSKVTTANEFIYDVLRNGSTRSGATVSMTVGAINVPINMGSMVNGPNIVGASSGQRGYWPGSPNGTINSTWNSKSVAAAQVGVANQFGGQLLTGTTGASLLLLPMQLEGNLTREIIKRRMATDTTTLADSRYHSKASVRILIDDEGTSASDAAGIPVSQGVYLSGFDPIPLPSATPAASPAMNGGGRALWRINENNTNYGNSYNETGTTYLLQQQIGTARQADTVRGVRLPVFKNITGATNANPIVITSANHGFVNGDIVYISGVQGNTNANGEYTIGSVTTNTFALTGRAGNAGYTANTGTVYKLAKSVSGTVIPYGSGITGHILIQIVDPSGNTIDVTRELLSLGMTEGEPNAIVTLQRPLWAAFVQGSRDASGATNPALNGDPVYTNTLVDVLTKTRVSYEGEIKHDQTNGYPALNSTYGYLTKVVDDTTSGAQSTRSDVTPSSSLALLQADWGASTTPAAAWYTNKDWNAIVPINVYNVREGHIRPTLTQNAIYERGITSVIEVNMRNLARWLDGVYDNNLLAGTTAVSTNINKPDGYSIYVSDRRGDRVKTLVASGTTVNATNGMVDNEDVYGPNGALDPGEDVQETGALVKDTVELPDPATQCASTPAFSTIRNLRAVQVAAWTNSCGYFRRSVRLFNGEDLVLSGAAGKLSATQGVTMATENLVYIWGNYNTTGINLAPPDGTSALNDSAATYHYNGDQVPASIVCDAFFPLSKTFFDAETAIYPDTITSRPADNALPGVTSETSVRAGIIAGNNVSALSGDPDADNGSDSRLSGGMHNFPRFLEDWLSANRRWNYVGSFIPLYHSTQAMGPWWYVSPYSIYYAPIRDWAFDTTFTDPNKLPPGTPLFQHIEPTGFKQVL